ncbi:hypothetical protein VPNG_01727 [Cytospora leucostoma]|uniref:MARVEL domain-containing protein n=1 Tax=Cytospora leucostoma TaxID=1230097 RepID=A0A423XJM5_9PEZI|nr:hypothetical protein VPNG_01727 [Cytospora leucostoma]
MLSPTILGLSVLQFAMAIAVLVLSISLLKNKGFITWSATWYYRRTTILLAILRYCVFLGVYGILAALITIASLFVSVISTLIPLLLQVTGALLFLAGGIVLALQHKKFTVWSYDAVTYTLKLVGYSDRFAENTGKVCKKCIADEVLLFALVPLSLGLAACAFLRRRSLRQSATDW